MHKHKCLRISHFIDTEDQTTCPNAERSVRLWSRPPQWQTRWGLGNEHRQKALSLTTIAISLWIESFTQFAKCTPFHAQIAEMAKQSNCFYNYIDAKSIKARWRLIHFNCCRYIQLETATQHKDNDTANNISFNLSSPISNKVSH